MSVTSFGGFRCFAGKVPFSRCFAARFASTNAEIQEYDVIAATAQKTASMSDKEVEKIRDKSRLNLGHRNLVNGRPPYDKPVHRYHDTVKYKRRMFGRYGESSKVYPGMAWPTAEDLEDRLEYERVAYPLTIGEMQQRALERLECERLEIQTRQRKIDENMRKLNGWLREVKEKAEKKVLEAQLVREKKERLVEEVKKHFGYKIDPKDERFKEMLVKREKEEKKKAREEKKKIREEKLLKYLKTKE